MGDKERREGEKEEKKRSCNDMRSDKRREELRGIKEERAPNSELACSEWFTHTTRLFSQLHPGPVPPSPLNSCH